MPLKCLSKSNQVLFLNAKEAIYNTQELKKQSLARISYRVTHMEKKKTIIKTQSYRILQRAQKSNPKATCVPESLLCAPKTDRTL